MSRNSKDENPWTANRTRQSNATVKRKYVTVARVGEISPDSMKLIRNGAGVVVIARVSDSYYAFEPLCPHEGAELHEGTLWGAVIDCPRHHYTFDLCTGANLYPKKVFPPDLASMLPVLQLYPVRIEAEEIQVGFPVE